MDEPTILKCSRCGHKWAKRRGPRLPKVCPNCSNPNWSRPPGMDLRKKEYRKKRLNE